MRSGDMQYRTILLNLNDEPRADALIKAALSLAKEHSAHLICLYVIPSALPPPELIGPVANTWLEDQMRGFRDQAQRIKSKLDSQMGTLSISHEWRLDDSRFDQTVADSVIAQGRAADLVIVSQGLRNGWLDDVPERVAIESGRPVLVVPQQGEFHELGSDVTIAWKASKEATRAVFDALPILQKARRVRLLTLVDDDDYVKGANDGSMAYLAATLLRHGIEAETEVAPRGDLPVGDRLLELSKVKGQELLVMGLYGHSRFREFVLGGVSRDVLQHMTIPVLLAH
jgi:nucleotide-binding universal stress UspA family protein